MRQLKIKRMKNKEKIYFNNMRIYWKKINHPNQNRLQLINNFKFNSNNIKFLQKTQPLKNKSFHLHFLNNLNLHPQAERICFNNRKFKDEPAQYQQIDNNCLRGTEVHLSKDMKYLNN